MDAIERVASGPVRGLRNWPELVPEVRAGNVHARPIAAFVPGADPLEAVWWVYTLTDLGRRRRAAFRGRFA